MNLLVRIAIGLVFMGCGGMFEHYGFHLMAIYCAASAACANWYDPP